MIQDVSSRGRLKSCQLDCFQRNKMKKKEVNRINRIKRMRRCYFLLGVRNLFLQRKYRRFGSKSNCEYKFQGLDRYDVDMCNEKVTTTDKVDIVRVGVFRCTKEHSKLAKTLDLSSFWKKQSL